MSDGSPTRFRAERLGDQSWLGPRLPPDRGRGQSFVGVLGGVRVAAFAVAPPRDARNPPGLGLALHLEPGLRPGVEAATERAVVGKAAAVAYWRSYQMQKNIRSAPYLNQALIGLGISALQAGDTGIAKKAFSLVQQNSAFNEVAALWTLYADTRTS